MNSAIAPVTNPMGRRLIRISFAATLLALSACGSSNAHKQAEQVHRELTGATSDDATSTNPLCKLFAPGDVATYENAPLKEPVDAAFGTGCQWMHREGQGSAMIQIASSEDHPEGAQNSRDLAGVGEKGFVEPYLGGWHAAAIADDKSINVMTSGSSSEEKTVAFLREAIARYSKH